MAERPAFIDRQYAFAAHLRDPEAHPAPADVEDRRMAVYRELFYNNVQDLLASNFPVLRKISSDPYWHALVRDFYAHHLCRTPLFLEIGQEFLEFLQQERGTRADDPPFLLELAHYEWIELALAIAEDEIPAQGIDPAGDLMNGVPALSPLAWPLRYDYAVHRIGPEYRPRSPEPQPVYLVAVRDRSDSIGFMEINPVTARLLELLQAETERTGAALLGQIAAELQHPQPDTVFHGGRETLEELRRRDIVLGTKTN